MRVLVVFGDTCYVACKEIVVAFKTGGTTSESISYVFDKSEGCSVIALTVTDQYVFCAFSNKYVCCWDRLSRVLLGSGLFKKRPTSIVYSKFEGTNREAIVVSDKTGDVWGSDVPLFKNQIILAGHTASVITDMSLSHNLIATSDRDEKVRVSRFPDLETIVSYCLGHTSVVSSVEFITVANENLLVSSSWDHKLCLWNPETGAMLSSFVYPDTSSSSSSSSGNAVEAEVSVDDAALDVADAPAADDAGGNDANILDEEEEKTYDESTAGHFPFKVTGSSVNGTSIVAVIFKNLPTLKLYVIDAASYEFKSELVLELPSAASDVQLTSNGRLVLQLTQPHFVQLFNVAYDAAKQVITAVDTTSTSSGVEGFKAKCIELGCAFSQVGDDQGGDGGDEEKGMKKHSLDKPFDRTKNIDYTKKRGAKRSKKN